MEKKTGKLTRHKRKSRQSPDERKSAQGVRRFVAQISAMLMHYGCKHIRTGDQQLVIDRNRDHQRGIRQISLVQPTALLHRGE